MKFIENKTSGKIAKVWVAHDDVIEESALSQIQKMLEIPGLFRHIAMMPDVHMGMGACIGSVVATKNIVFPNIVGVDIGCGMSAYCTNVHFDEKTHDERFWKIWEKLVRSKIPVGFNMHNTCHMLEAGELKADSLYEQFANKICRQIGTLGGGNHFIEAQVDENELIWLMVHSGSRNIGLQIAKYYNNLAKNFNERYYSKTPKDLWFLSLDENGGKNYIADIQWAVKYATESRWRMLEHLAEDCFSKIEDVRNNGININHNFAAIENHFGENVIVHRKGATRARDGDIGIIPGSMGSNSYIVEGKGFANSFCSCSHGAGRVMSRKEAKQKLTKEQFVYSMKETFTSVNESQIDEAPGAYKDIDKIILNQNNLISIKHILKPLITIKG